MNIRLWLKIHPPGFKKPIGLEQEITIPKKTWDETSETMQVASMLGLMDQFITDNVKSGFEILEE